MTTTKRTIKEIYEAIEEHFNDNDGIFTEVLEELDCYMGYLGDDRYYPMDELDELFCNESPTDLLNKAFFGHDEEAWTTDAHGDREYGAFNPNREYFTFNGYGNLVSADYKDYSCYNDEYLVNALIDNRGYIDIWDDELNDLLDELIEAFDEEE